MKAKEIVTLNDVLDSSQYIQLLHRLKTEAGGNVDITHIKNQIIQSWKKGMKHRKHYDDLLCKIDLSLNKLL
jgi:aryl carrier-like protein